MLRAAGAVIMGKTVTTECATYAPGKTRNPHNPEHTPGGSSSGSAAAVAAGMVPLALGSQTNGSVIRPAAFCGVYGFKPTHGLIPRHGILKLSRTLDHVGVFARTIEDIALLAEQLVGCDEDDPDTRPRARLPFRERRGQEPPLPPLLAFVKGPTWERAEEETREAFAELVAELGERVVEVRAARDGAARARLAPHDHGSRDGGEPRPASGRRGATGCRESLRSQLARGREVRALDYQQALARIPLLNEGFAELFDRYDAILTPGGRRAPRRRASTSTGDPAFCTLWTLCGMPALTLPLMQGENGLPLGVQLVGPRHGDARLLRTARWLAGQVEGNAGINRRERVMGVKIGGGAGGGGPAGRVPPRPGDQAEGDRPRHRGRRRPGADAGRSLAVAAVEGRLTMRARIAGGPVGRISRRLAAQVSRRRGDGCRRRASRASR